MSATASLFSDAGLLAQAIADATDDAVFARDREGRYRYANPAMLAAIGRGAARCWDGATTRSWPMPRRRVAPWRRTGACWIPGRVATWSRP